MDFYDYDNENIFRKVISIFTHIVVVITLAVFCVYGFGCSVEDIGLSMTPTLESGERAMLDRLSYKITQPKRDDIIVFTDDSGNINIKRIVGLPGEIVKIDGGLMYIDGNPSEYGQVSLAGLAANEIELKSDEYFVLGDNTEASEDSRFDTIGNVKREDIIGKLWLRYYPVIRLGYIG